MPRMKGSKKTFQNSHTDYLTQITAMQETIASLNTEIVSIWCCLARYIAENESEKQVLTTVCLHIFE